MGSNPEHDRLPGTDGEPLSAASRLAEAVAAASAALSGKLDPQAIRDTIVELATRLLGADLSLLHGAAADPARSAADPARPPTDPARPAADPARPLADDAIAPFGRAVTPDGRAGPLLLLASSGLPSALAGALDELSSTPSLVLRAAERRCVEHTATDEAAGERFADVRAIEAVLRPSWVLACPLLAGDALLGVLTCALGDRSPPLPEILPRARALCAVFALALAATERAATERAATERAATERHARRSAGDHPLDDEAGASAQGQQRAEDLRREAQAALRQAEERLAAERLWLRSIIEDFPVALAVFDERDGRSLLASRRCEELCGGAHPLKSDWSCDERVMLCKPGGQPLELHEMPLVRAARGLGTTCEELWFRRIDGSFVPVVVSAGPIRDDRGAILGAIASYEDVTHFTDRERLREEWTSIVAHDLKQPLTAITACAGVLSRRAETADVAVWSQKILTSVRRLERMTEDLLDASKIEARHLSLDRRPVDLRAHLRAAVELAAAERPERAVELTADEDVPPVHLDVARIDQVLGNLLVNAAKYGDPGAATRVTLSRRDDEVEVAIENRGPGIDPDDLPRLFQRFQRLSPGGSRRTPPGTGLGLYICKGIVEAHGGRIWAESKPGTTSFHFTLPL